jgi:flagella basal body P-ring formation protein FlgA
VLAGLLLATATIAAAADASAPTPTDAVTTAIARAVQHRLGEKVTVSVWAVTGLRLSGEPVSLTAIPEPATRIGVPSRFVFTAANGGRGTVRVGEAVATIQAVGPVLRTAHELERGAVLAASDVHVVSADLSGRPLRPLPTLDDAVGARVTRRLDAQTLLTTADIIARPIVRAGAVVTAHANIDGVQVTGELIAAESGVRDEVIRVVNSETRHTARARVIGENEVEVLDVR